MTDPAEEDAPDPIRHQDADWRARADRNLREIIRLQTELFAIRQSFDTEIERLTERRDTLIARLDANIDWHRRPLEQLHAALLVDDPKACTIILPHGELRSRTPRTPAYRFTDRDAFVEWALVNAPDMLTPTWKVDAATVKNDPRLRAASATVVAGEPSPVIADSGEIVPGVEFALGHVTYSIEPEGCAPW